MSVVQVDGYDQDGHLIDTLGRSQPTRLNWLHFIRAVPGLATQFDRKVPDEFWSVDALEDRTPVAVIACPCGKEPIIPLGSCVECDCERFYLYLGSTIRVANSPRPEATAA